jgi:hypothetical protein
LSDLAMTQGIMSCGIINEVGDTDTFHAAA